MGMNRTKICLCLATACAVIAGHTAPIGAYSTAAYKWASWPVPFYVNPANSDVSASAATSAIQAGMDVWNTQSGTAFRFSYAGQVKDTSTSADGRNVVIFRNTSNPDSPGAVATTYAWSQNGSRFDTDIVFWDGPYHFFTGSSGCAYTNGQYGAYIEDIVTHELGHALGLNHSSVTDATMYATYTQCSTSFRTLAADDIAGIKSLYPASSDSNSAPTVDITGPASGTSITEGASLTFNGSASDVEDGNLTSKIAWSSNIDGSLGVGTGFSTILSAGSHVITARVTDSNGASASDQISISVAASPTNTAPTVTISAPASGTTVNEGASLIFSGSASDTQDGSITAKLSWTSSIDGAIGTGTGFSKVLSAGSHTITARVTDSGGMSGSKSVSVTVSASSTSSSTPTLTAKGRKVKGSQNVDLAWSNVTATNVDIYRNGAKIQTTGNDGVATDNINKKGNGSYTYKVCAAGSSTCTNQASVSF
jgi:hypothetical protein